MISLALSSSLVFAVFAAVAPAKPEPQPVYMGHYAAMLLAQEAEAQQNPSPPGALSELISGDESAATTLLEESQAVPPAPGTGDAPAPQEVSEPSASNAPAPPELETLLDELSKEQMRMTQARPTPGRAQVAPSPSRAEISKAEAEVQLAEAEHNKVCQSVAREVTLTYQKLQRAREAVEHIDITNPRMYQVRTDTIGSVADLETELRFLLGSSLPVQDSGKAQFIPLPERLEDSIVAALHGNPDIKESLAKVEVAKRNLDSVQFRFAQEAAAIKNRIQRLEAMIDATAHRVDVGTESSDKLLELRFQLDEAVQASRQYAESGPSEADRARAAFYTAYDAHPASEDIAEAWPVPVTGTLTTTEIKGMSTKKRPEMTAELQNILEQPVTISADGGKLPEVLEAIANHVNNSPGFGSPGFVLDIAVDSDAPLTMSMENTPMKSVLLALTDQLGDTCFVFRDYGIFVTTRERAKAINAPAIPDDLPYVGLPEASVR